MTEPLSSAAGRENVREIVADLMTEIRANATTPPARRSYARAAKYVIYGALTSACLIAWIAPPPWLVPPPPAGPSPAKRDASLRVLIGLTAQRVDAFRASHHRLPNSGAELGVTNAALDYTRIDSATFAIRGIVGRDTITYHSTTPRRTFLGNALHVVQTSR